MRHLSTQHGITRAQYLQRFDLRPDELIAETTRLNQATRPDYFPYSFAELRRKLAEIQAETSDLQEVRCKRAHPAFFDQVVWLYGGWYEGVQAIGVDPKEIRKFRTWSKERVLREIRLRKKKKLDLAGTRFRETQFNLIEAARRHFGSYRNALAAAGISASEIGLYPQWGKDRVLSELRQLGRKQQRGKVDRELLSAAQRYFGSLRNAVRAAGLDESRLFGKTFWSKQKVVEKVRALARSGARLNSKQVVRDHNDLYIAGTRRFGSWDQVLLAAGLDPDKIREAFGNKSWSKKKITDLIQSLANDPASLCASHITRKHNDLYLAAKRWFGSWDRALRAAGFDPEKTHLIHPKRSAKDIVSELKRIHATGDPMYHTEFARKYSKLFASAVWRYGSLRRAKIAAGIPIRIKPRRDGWSEERIIAAIQAARGANPQAKLPSALVSAAQKKFGTLRHAMEVAGIEPVTRLWTRDSIIAEIKRRVEQGLSIRARHVAEEDGGLCMAAYKRFGSWIQAVEAAGLDYEEVTGPMASSPRKAAA